MFEGTTGLCLTEGRILYRKTKKLSALGEVNAVPEMDSV